MTVRVDIYNESINLKTTLQKIQEIMEQEETYIKMKSKSKGKEKTFRFQNVGIEWGKMTCFETCSKSATLWFDNNDIACNVIHKK